MKQRAEKVEWADVRENLMDTNDGYVFGLYYLTEEGEVQEVCWYKSNGEREGVIQKENLVVQN